MGDGEWNAEKSVRFIHVCQDRALTSGNKQAECESEIGLCHSDS